jgi:hypothetical protein
VNLKKLIAFFELLLLLLASAGTVAAAQTAANTAGQATNSGSLGTARVQERRSFNPNSTTHYTTGMMPSTAIKAAEYGALRNGINDDTAAIQAAVNGLSVVSGGVGLAGPPAMGSGTVELPQGRCEISSPIILMNYGSLIGSANGTWITPKEPWQSSNTDMVEDFFCPHRSRRWRQQLRLGAVQRLDSGRKLSLYARAYGIHQRGHLVF